VKKWQKSIPPLFFTALVMILGVSGHAEEADQSLQTEPDIEYEESTPITSKVEQVQLEETKLPEALEVQSVQPSAQMVPQGIAQAPPVPAPVPAEGKTQATGGVNVLAAGELVQSAAMPSGLLEINGFKYPVYLFVPKDYRTDRTYSMIMMAPAKLVTAQDQIDYLTGLAQRKSVFILAPYVLWPKSGTTPESLDSWLLSVKNEILQRFPIGKKRVYLVGKDSGAQYAAYMAVKYPKEFAAAALLGEAWDGPFSKLIHPQADAADQIPFYIALKADGDAAVRNQVWLDTFQKKGYLLHLVDYKNDADLADLEFKKSFFDWMETASQNWAVSVAQGHQTWKGKIKKGVKDFFAV
jgi:hypothetical protein